MRCNSWSFCVFLLMCSLGLYGQQSIEARSYIEEHEGQIDPNRPSSTLYYNLGTAYLQVQQVAKARLYLERATLLDPFNTAILNNLTIAKNRANIDIVELPEFFLNRWIHTIIISLNSNIWAALSLLLILLLLLSLYLRWIKRSYEWYNNNYFLTLLIGSALLCGLFSFFNYQMIHNNKYAIVMQSEKLYEDILDKSVKTTLNAGVKVEIISPEAEWTKVKTLDLQEGWIKTQSYERI